VADHADRHYLAVLPSPFRNMLLGGHTFRSHKQVLHSVRECDSVCPACLPAIGLPVVYLAGIPRQTSQEMPILSWFL
jgi:hypothetical protein